MGDDHCSTLINDASKGNVQAFNSIRDMVEGKPVQRLEESDPDEISIQPSIAIRFVSPEEREKT